MAVFLVDEQVQQFSRTRSRGAPLVRRREEDFPRMVREGVEPIRRAGRRRVRQVWRRLDDLRRVAGVDRNEVSVGDSLRRFADLLKERKDLIRT